MTGCPNGCVRPYQSDIGIVGRSGDKYTVFVGGNLVGSRLNFRAEGPGADRARSCRRWCRCWRVTRRNAKAAKASAIIAIGWDRRNCKKWRAERRKGPGYPHHPTSPRRAGGRQPPEEPLNALKIYAWGGSSGAYALRSPHRGHRLLTYLVHSVYKYTEQSNSPRSAMKTPRIDIGSIRREQIVDAAVAVIAEQGLQHLSLSEIEKKVGMSPRPAHVLFQGQGRHPAGGLRSPPGDDVPPAGRRSEQAARRASVRQDARGWRSWGICWR